MLNTPELRTWIQSQLDERGWSHTYLANQVETNASSWSHFFRGSTKSLNPGTAAKVATLFDVSYSHLEAISQGRGDEFMQRVYESGNIYETKWIRLGKWAEGQNMLVQEAMEAVARSHGWQ